MLHLTKVKRIEDNRDKTFKNIRKTALSKLFPALLGITIIALIIGGIITSILAPLYLDNIIPNEDFNSSEYGHPWWLIPYSCLGFIFVPCFAMTIVMHCIGAGYFPGLSQLYKVFKRRLPGKNASRLGNCLYFTLGSPSTGMLSI
jgi:hypothetical protein